MSRFEVSQYNLNSNIPLVACNTNASNVNPTGVTSVKKDFWVANTGSSTLSHYNKKGIFLNNVTSTGPPTGIVSNCSTYFNNYSLITVTNNGLIEGYNANVNAGATVVAVNNPTAIYTGVAIHKNKLYVANFSPTGPAVEVYDNTFTLLSTFTDPNLTAIGYAPYNVVIDCKHVYVAFAKADGIDAVAGIGLGFVDRFKLDGTHLHRFINNDPLNAPYGLLFSECGKFLYVANRGDGKINIFSQKDGCFIKSLKDCHDNEFQLGGITGIAEYHKDIVVVAGINQENSGLLALLKECEQCSQ